MLHYNDEQIRIAKKIGEVNAREHPKAPEGFWFEKVYIVNPFLDKTGEKNLTFRESVNYYGEENIKHFFETKDI